MPIKLYRRKGSNVWHYRGTIAGDRLRGTTRTESRELAARIASEVENRHHKRHLDGPQEVLTFPQAVALYLKAEKSNRFLSRIEDYWKNAKVKDMTPGAIQQSAIDIYPKANGATRNRQVITPTQAVINHCHSRNLCPPVRIERFKFEKKIKKPVLLDWLDTFCVHAERDIAALATFMFATGCRISEARRLEWSDIDFKERTILVRKTKNKKERLPYMPNRLLVALANLPRDQRPFYKPENTLRRHWDWAIEAAAKAQAGFERLTFHSCRHGFATTLLRKGVDAKTAAHLGGWDSIQLFMETYAHAIQEPSLTDKLFDTPLTQQKVAANKNNDLEEN